MNASRTKRMNVKVPLIIFGLVAALILIVFLLTPQPGTAPDESAAGQTPAEHSESEGPDLTQFERRDSEDLLAAGPVDAAVGLIVFSDYQCPYCAQWNQQTLPTMMEYAERGDLRIEWRDLNVFGPESERASYATYAAALQGKFWEYHEELYANGEKRSKSQLSEEALVSLAGELGLDPVQFASDMASDQTRAEIERNQQLGFSLGASSTPVFLLDGAPIMGAQPTEVFVQALERALASRG